jgi:DNA invertase Pin-like site-specific DNA recombinase
MNVTAYLRVSTDEQNLGLEAQRAKIAAFCKANGHTLISEHVDHGVSGGLEIDKRPALLAALDDISDNTAQALIVAKRCRLARDGYVAAMVYRLVERNGGSVICADGVANGDSPEDKLMRGMLDLFAQYERELIRARTRAALNAKRAKGEHTGGHARFGFTVVDGREVVNERERQAAALARQLRADGVSLRKIGEALAARGFETRSGGKWHASSVKCLLRAA